MSSRPSIVVGVDGSDAAIDALQWAVTQADRWGADVHAVCAWSLDPFSDGPADLWASATVADAEEAAGAALQHCVSNIESGQTQIDQHIVPGHPARVLAEMGQGPDAMMIVVGRRGLGRLATVLLGSTSRALIHNAPCPVAVVPRGSHDSAAPSLVGIDGSAGGLAALRWADRWAGPHLLALHAWRVHYLHTTPLLPRSEFGRLAQRRMERTQQQFEAGGPPTATTIEYRLVEGDARSVLVGHHGSLLVVGRCHGLPARMVGSVAAAVTVRASIPTIVTPPGEGG